SCSFAFASRSIFGKASYSHIMSSPRLSYTSRASNGLRFAAQAAMTSPNSILGGEPGVQSQGGYGYSFGGVMGAVSGGVVLPMIDLRCPWREITAVIPADSYWNAPAFSFASMVIVRTAEGSPIPIILPVSSYGALWSRLQALEAAHRALHTPQDSTGTRIIDTVGENVYYGGFSPVDDGSLSLCVVTRQEARGQFSGDL
ncbi:hypothetical protein EV714DRAFT_218543, partial [Schizophyllum commune]